MKAQTDANRVYQGVVQLVKELLDRGFLGQFSLLPFPYNPYPLDKLGVM